VAYFVFKGRQQIYLVTLLEKNRIITKHVKEKGEEEKTTKEK